MRETAVSKSIIPGWKAIGFMVVKGFGLFLSISGMAGIAIDLGPLNSVVRDLTFTPGFREQGLCFPYLSAYGGCGRCSGLCR